MKLKKILLLIIMIIMSINTVNALEKKTSAKENKTTESSILIADSVGTCNKTAIFGDPNTDGTVANLIESVLKYPRYIVPALILAFTGIDFFKAVTAGSEDEMKKAQKTAIKRLIAGVAVFLVPVMVKIIMFLADVAWRGLDHTCIPS